MMTRSPARAQRRASPKPSGPVPPRTAMVRVMVALTPSSQPIALTCSCELRLERFLQSEVLGWQLDIDPGVGGIALGGNASDLENQRLELFRAGVLSRRGSGFARDVFLHQGAAVVVRAGVQAKLRQATVQLHPGHLNIVDGAGQHDSRQRMDLEMLGQGWAGP